MFCALAVLLQNYPQIQVIAGLTFTMCCAILQFTARPFLNDTLDVLDCFSMVSIFLYLCCGLCFQDKSLANHANPHHGTYLLLPKLAQGVAGLNCCFAILTFYLDLRAGNKANSIKAALTAGVSAAIKTTQHRLQNGSVNSLTHTEAELLDSVLLSSVNAADVRDACVQRVHACGACQQVGGRAG